MTANLQRVSANSPELRAEVVRRLRGIQDAIADLQDDLHEALAMIAICDGTSAEYGDCVLAWHQGPHRNAGGDEWLDS